MFRRLLRLIFQLVVLALVIFSLTATWIIFDGLTDLGEKADVAVVPGHGELRNGVPEPGLQARLDRAVQLYDAGEFPVIAVCGVTRFNGYNEPESMAHYLEAHGVAAGAIIEIHQGSHTEDGARALAAIMKAREFHSVMVVTDYYHVTRLKLALRHEGIAPVEQAHAGKLRKEDALKIAREVVALYDYLGKFYLLPAAKKAADEAKVGEEKVKEEAEKAKGKVDKSPDSLVK